MVTASHLTTSRGGGGGGGGGLTCDGIGGGSNRADINFNFYLKPGNFYDCCTVFLLVVNFLSAQPCRERMKRRKPPREP